MMRFQALSATMLLYAEDIGTAALFRMSMVFLQTMVYFPDFDLTSGPNDIHGTLANLSGKYAYNQRVDPVNFKLLATPLQPNYTSPFYAFWEKFLYQVADVEIELYR